MLACRSQRTTDGENEVRGGTTRTSPEIFWVHLSAFAAYNVLVGYLLVHRDVAGTGNLFVYVTAMGMHFVVNDHGLRAHHRDAYQQIGRWLLSPSVLLGLLVGFLVGVPELAVSLLFAFLAGGIVLNVIKEELPEERQSRFVAFVGGVLGYSVLLLVL